MEIIPAFRPQLHEETLLAGQGQAESAQGRALWKGQVAPSREGEGVTEVSVSGYSLKGLKWGLKPPALA